MNLHPSLMRLVEQQPQTYERYLVTALIHSLKFYRTLREHLCPYEEDLVRHRPDFSVARYNLLYPVIDSIWRMYDKQDLKEDCSIPREQLEAFIIDQSNSCAAGSKTEEMARALSEEMTVDFYAGSVPSEEFMKALKGEVFAYWLNLRVTKHFKRRLDHSVMDTHITLDDIQSQLSECQTKVLVP